MVGAIVTAAGVVSWAIGLTIFEPAVHRNYDAQLAGVGVTHLGVDADDMAQMALWAKDLRWAAMVLAIGGLLIVFAGAARLAVLAAAPPWLVFDFSLDRTNVTGWRAALLLIGGVGLLAALGLWAAWPTVRKGYERPGSKAILIYSGVAATAAVSLFYVEPGTKAWQPDHMMQMAMSLGIGLALAAVFAALTAAPTVSRARAWLALGLTFLIIIPAIVVEVRRAWVEGSPVAMLVVPVVVAPALLLVLCLALVRRKPSLVGWLGYAALALVGSAASLVLMWIGVVVSYQLQYTIVPLTGDRAYFDGYQMTVAAVLAGVVFGALMYAVDGTRATPAVGSRSAPSV